MTLTRRKIFNIQIVHEIDVDPDTSYLGEYANSPTSEYSIDRQHSTDCPINTGVKPFHQWEQTTDINGVDNETACTYCEVEQTKENINQTCEDADALDNSCDCGNHGDMERNQYRYFNPSQNYNDCTPEEIRKYTLRDYERMERLNRGDWAYLLIGAVAEVGVSLNGGKDYLCQKISSGFIGGIESDSEDSYLEETGKEQLGKLKIQLLAFGFGRSIVARALKCVETINR